MPLDAATLAAIADRGVVVPRNFVLVTAKDGAGDPVLFGFTDFGDDVTLDVVDALSGLTVSRDYYGDEAPLLALDPMPLRIGLEVDVTAVVLNPLHAAVADMLRGHDCRNAPVQIHRAYLDPASMLPVAAPFARRVGWVDGAPEELAAAGGQAGLRLQVVSVTRELTRVNPARRSDETQRLRSGDRFRRYAGTAHMWPIFWGEAKAAPDRQGGGGGRRR